MPKPKAKELKLPKASLVLKNEETGEVVARKGMWTRLPKNNEVLKASYERE